MSKILDLLNYAKNKEAARKEESGVLSDHLSRENFDSGTKEKLARTYIFNPADGQAHPAKGEDKHVLPARYHSDPPRSGAFNFFPWLIAFLAVVLLLANIAYRGKININIEILGGGTPKSAPAGSKKTIELKEGAGGEKSGDISTIYTSLISEEGINRLAVKRLGFYGAAVGGSKLLHGGLYLLNNGTAGWASAGLDLNQPMDLSDATLDFFIKGAKGNESLELILRDAENSSYMPHASIVLYKKSMSPEWQYVSVPFESFNGAYNVKKINHIGFEFGTQTTSNEPNSAMYIKKVAIMKSGASAQRRDE